MELIEAQRNFSSELEILEPTEHETRVRLITRSMDPDFLHRPLNPSSHTTVYEVSYEERTYVSMVYPIGCLMNDDRRMMTWH